MVLKIKEYDCFKCGKHVMYKTVRYDKDGNLICYRCFNIEKFGVPSTMNVPAFKEKYVATNLKKYGVASPFSTEKARENIRKGMIAKYGVPHPISNEEVRAKARASLKEKYGAEHGFQSPIIQQKIKETLLERYGVQSPGYLEWCDRDKWTREQRNSPENLEIFNNLAEKEGYTLLSKTREKGKDTIFTYFCPDCRKEFRWCIKDWRRVFCTNCKREHNVMFFNQVKEFFDTIGFPVFKEVHDDEYTIFDIDNSDISILLVDVTICDTRDNSYLWHEYRKNGRSLILMTDWEWENMRPQMMAYLKRILGIGQIIEASECEIRSVDMHTDIDFQRTNSPVQCSHFDSSAGLFYNNELIQILSICTERKTSKRYPRISLVTKMGFIVRGGFTRLVDYYISEYKPDVFYVYAYKDKDEFLDYSKFEAFSEKHEISSSYLGSSRVVLGDQIKKRIILNEQEPTLTRENNKTLNGYHLLYNLGYIVYRWRRT